MPSLRPHADTFVSMSEGTSSPASRTLSTLPLANMIPIITFDSTKTEIRCTKQLERPEVLMVRRSLMGPSSNVEIAQPIFSRTSSVRSLLSLKSSCGTPVPTLAPESLVAYAKATGHITEDGTDIWLSEASLRLSEVVPCIPPEYGAEARAGRALYVIGVPRKWPIAEFKGLFSSCGTVEKCPAIIDLESEETFRWVIMSTTADTETVVDRIHDTLVNGYSIKLCKALPPGKNLSLEGRFSIEQLFRKTSARKRAIVQGHPSTPPPAEEQSPSKRKSPPLPQQTPLRQRESAKTSDGLPHIGKATTEFTTQASSWANIARTTLPNSSTIDLHPGKRLASAAPRLQPIGRIPKISSPVEIELLVEQMRIVFLLNLPQSITLNDVADAIKEGPVCSIRFGVDVDDGNRYAGIIFQHARDAESFFQVLRMEREASRPCRFRFIVDVVRGEAFPADQTINAMSAPTFATRRLTIVKSRFFFMFGERQLRLLCEKLVGPENIQLIWLYNGGNATVVFAEVAAAIKVKEALDKMRDGAGLPGGVSQVYAGLQTTFSKDPCEVELVYKTAMVG